MVFTAHARLRKKGTMGYPIPNSNQFSAGDRGTTFTPSDFRFDVPGADLPSVQEDNIDSNEPIHVTLFLRRNQHETEKPTEGFIPAEEIVNLSYKKLIRYINGISKEEIISWYGASDRDIEAVANYINKFGGTDVSINKEQRKASFTVTYSQFKEAFLGDRPEMLTNASGGKLFYYNPTDYASSYLTADGDGSQDFAAAIIGITNEIDIEDDQEGTNESEASSKGSDAPGFAYYPSEIAKLYDFPSHKTTGAGKGVTIGLIGADGNRFRLLNQGNAFNKYLQAQDIDTKRLGKVRSPNDVGAEGFWSESAMDYSILRSIAPRANIVVSTNDQDNFQNYAELIYNTDADIISSSYTINPAPGQINGVDALHQMYVDAILRGKSVVIAAGDQGTGNTEGAMLLPNGKPYANYSTGDSAILAVGGTAFLGPKSQFNIPPETRGQKPSRMPKEITGKRLDKITGLIGDQLMWNDTKLIPSPEIAGDVDIYPGLQDQFVLRDFEDATEVAGAIDNTTGSSGVFPETMQAMPRYQRKNLEDRWQGSGRRYPDVSVLAGSNVENGFNSYYYVFDLKNGKPILSTTGGGTSAGAPLLAGLLANITSGLRKKFGKQSKTAFVNPYLYEKYRSGKQKNLFIDVPKGSNNASTYSVASNPDDWPSEYFTSLVIDDTFYLLPLNGTGPGGSLDLNLSSTGKGFDAASGLGSINGQALFDGLSRVWSTI
jgi:subtilase family serine protease